MRKSVNKYLISLIPNSIIPKLYLYKKTNSLLTQLEMPKSKQPGQLKKEWVIPSVALSSLLFAINVNIIDTVLPAFAKALETNVTNAQWVIWGYNLVLVTLMLSAGCLGDIFGRKKMYLTGLIIFTAASLLCGLSPNIDWLLKFRVLQGIGASFISGLGLAIITEAFPNSKAGTAIGIICGVFSLAFGFAPPIGKWMLHAFGWRSFFFANVPIGIISCLMAFHLVPSKDFTRAKQGFDVFGVLMMTTTLVCFALGMTYIQNANYLGIAIALVSLSVITLVGFVTIESYVREPIIDLKVFYNLQLTLSLLTEFLAFIVFPGTNVLIYLFLVLVLQRTPQHSTLLVGIITTVVVLTSVLSGMLLEKKQPQIISLIGLSLMLLGCFSISTFDRRLSDLDFLLRVAPISIGFALFHPANNIIVLKSVPNRVIGTASGFISLCHAVGQIISIPLMRGFWEIFTPKKASFMQIDISKVPSLDLINSFGRTFSVAAIMIGLGICLTIFTFRTKQAIYDDF